jgi:hypothetical protein
MGGTKEEEDEKEKGAIKPKFALFIEKILAQFFQRLQQILSIKSKIFSLFYGTTFPFGTNHCQSRFETNIFSIGFPL